MRQEQPQIAFIDSVAFLTIAALDDIFTYQALLDEKIAAGQIVALAIIWNGPVNSERSDRKKRSELYHWFQGLVVLTVAVADNFCFGDCLELLMICDIRLGGSNLTVRFPDDTKQVGFDFAARCQMLMGNESSDLNLRNTTLSCQELFAKRFLNEILAVTAEATTINEVQRYLKQILSNKDHFQIKAIIKCFKHYQKLGLNTEREILLAEETRQFCALVFRSFKNEGVG